MGISESVNQRLLIERVGMNVDHGCGNLSHFVLTRVQDGHLESARNQSIHDKVTGWSGPADNQGPHGSFTPVFHLFVSRAPVFYRGITGSRTKDARSS